MKVFKRKNINRVGSNSSRGTAATAEVSSLSVVTSGGGGGENDTILSSETTNTATTNRTTNRQHKKMIKKLKLTRKPSKEESIAEARQRAAKRLEPPPFTTSKLSRLDELKEAKARAEERIEERSQRGGSSGSSVISISMNSIRSSGTTASVKTFGTNMSMDLEEDQVVKRDALLFISSTILHLALLPLRNFTSFLPILLVTLQAMSLRFLLSSLLVYAFDNIDFGQKELVKNMEYGKKLVVVEIRKYSTLVSAVVGVASFVVAIGKSIVQQMAHILCSEWQMKESMCGGFDETAFELQSWGVRALNISTFVTVRMGVFIVAFLFLGQMLLPPKPSQKRRRHQQPVVVAGEDDNSETAANENDQGEENQSIASDGICYGQRRTMRKRHKANNNALATSVSFLLATVAIIALTKNTVSAAPSFSTTTASQKAIKSILVAGSMNADTFLPIQRFPSPGENLTLLPGRQPMVDVPGGKGCNQAIACSKLGSSRSSVRVSFLGQFGNDSAAKILQSALVDNDVDVSSCGYSMKYPSGRGYVMIVPDTGEVSAVVSGGSNLYGWSHWGAKFDVSSDFTSDEEDLHESSVLTDEDIREMVASHSLVLLQCEVPTLVNQRLARAARSLHIPVIVDVGGEDRKMERELLDCCDYLVPNETELERLAGSYSDISNEALDVQVVLQRYEITSEQMEGIQAQIGPSLNLPSILQSVNKLQKNGASNVLVTLGSSGSLLVMERGSVLYAPPCHLPDGTSVVDETGAGDCYRAGFAVSLLEHCKGDSGDVDDETLMQCMKFAAAAGALAVTKNGAVPAIPSRMEVDDLLAATTKKNIANVDTYASPEAVPRGGGDEKVGDVDFPFLFGSRINSMKDRLDLVDPALPMSTPRDYLQRQATIEGLGCVDFNYPQHFGDHWTPQDAKAALDEVGLAAGAVCLRYPAKFARGAMNHPDEDMRREAIEMTKQAAEAARILGCNEVVVWSAYDGYDYPFQVSYQEKWDQIVSAFRELCDAYPDIKWSLEYKPTDENTRFFTVPSTGAAILLVKEIDRPNMGLTLDVGHMLMSGENPGQSIAMTGDKLFGIQLNDGYTRLAAEDGMMFGSIHPSMALEIMFQLRQINFGGHFYFDTFPQRTDPVKESEYNIQKVKQFWKAVEMMDSSEVERIAREHDAIGALELVNEALRR